MGTSLPPVGVRFQAQGVEQVASAFTQLQTRATTAGGAMSRTFVEGSGRVSAFGRQSVQSINAAGFAMSQLAATGNVGFRSLASSAAGFASFFGPAGLIASGVIGLGLVLTDFWNRQRREIEETRKKADAEFDALITARREKDTPVAVAEERLAERRTAVQAINAELDRLVRVRNLRQISAAEQKVFDEQFASLSAKKAQALAREFEALRLVNDARAKATKGLPEVKVEGKSNAPSELDRQKALSRLVDTLTGLAKLDALRSVDLKRMATVEAELNAELSRSNITLERRLELLQQLAQITPILARANKAAALIDADLGRPQVGASSSAPPARSQLPLPVIPVVPDGTAEALRARMDALLTEIGESMTPTMQAVTARIEDMIADAGGVVTIDVVLNAEALVASAKRVDATFLNLGQAFGSTLADSIATAAAGGSGKDALLAGLGGIFQEMGKALLVYGLTMSGLLPAFSNPITSGPAAIAAGAALTALGGALGGAASGRGGGGFSSSAGGFSSPASSNPIDIRRLIVDPNLQRPITAARPQVIEVIGSETPRGQQMIGTANARYVRRGG
jgi:hypothetical protein